MMSDETDSRRPTFPFRIGRRLGGLIGSAAPSSTSGSPQLGSGHEISASRRGIYRAARRGRCAVLFFIAYFIFEVPSNLLMRRFGARIWIARIMITWGIVTVVTGFVTNYPALIVLRFLLVWPSRLLPGMIFYLNQWFRAMTARSRWAGSSSPATSSSWVGCAAG